MSKVVVKAEFFIIPNKAAKASSFAVLPKWYGSNGEKLGIYGDETVVQIWITNSKDGSGDTSENWGDHGIPKRLRADPEKSELALNRIPLCLIEDLKEDESIEVNINGHIVEMTARQTEYRYRRFGRFEECLKAIR